jgi:hypothetical protein
MDLRRLVLLWAAWLVIICGFQIVVQARLQPERPDTVLSWTSNETGQQYLVCRPLLGDPAMNEHASFDSEYYISIATGGYNDPNASAYSRSGPFGFYAGVPSCSEAPEGWTSLNYAFMPGYPTAMRAVIAVIERLPFTSDLTDIGRATLAGIIVSAIGGLLAMLGLARLWAYIERRRKSRKSDSEPVGAWGGSGGLRAALYLLIFPTGFYLAQVYTEGLFIGLAFMACAMAVERKIAVAAALAALATIVRPGGAFLFFPIAWAAFQIAREATAQRRAELSAGREPLPAASLPGRAARYATDAIAAAAALVRPSNWRIAVPAVLSLAPVAVFVAWYTSSLGATWRSVEDGFFGRRFDIFASWDAWWNAWHSMINGVDKTGTPGGYQFFGGGQFPFQSSSSVYLALEFFAIFLAAASIVWLFRRAPGVALFGLGIFILSFGSQAGATQGMIRYVLAVPAIFLMLGSFGRFAIFDRAWVMGSTLVMGMLAMLFTFGFWVA